MRAITMAGILSRLKRLAAYVMQPVTYVMRKLIVGIPMPLGLQYWAIKWLLPTYSWPKSLAYQQCMANRIIKKYGTVTQAGPFKGMVCIRDADEGCLVPKLLGCYEEELIPTAEAFIQRGYDRIIDVGCASGYWLVGFALRMPQAEAFGFDIDNDARARCAELVALNNVHSRVTLLGGCTPAALEKLITKRTLVFMDIDGPEYEILNPDLAPALRQADIIVECHDYLNPKITPTLQERFKKSHTIEKISSRVREPSLERYPGLDVLPQNHWADALAERRPAVQDWLIMRVKESNSYA